MKNNPRIITIANHKGGSGKTTTALALAQAGKAQGLKVLCIDLDGQGNLTTALNGTTEAPSVIDFITGSADPSSCIQETSQGVYLIRGSYDLAGLETSKGSAIRLKKALEATQEPFNLVVIDTPPTLGEAQYNALRTSTGLIVPLGPSLFDLQGLYSMVETAKTFKKANNALEVLGYVMTNYNGRSKLAKTLESEIEADALTHGVANLGTIRQGVAIREAQALKVSLFDYAPASKPALDYLNLFRRIISLD